MSDMLRRVALMMQKSVVVKTYTTWNPSDKWSFLALSGGNLVATSSGFEAGKVRTSLSKSSGKWYWEVTATNGTPTWSVGISKAGTALGTYLGAEANEWGYLTSGSLATAGSPVAYGSSYTTGDVIGCALDMDAGTMTFYKNNVSQGVAVTGLTGSVFAAWGASASAGSKIATANFGASAFVYSPPSGYNSGLYT